MNFTSSQFTENIGQNYKIIAKGETSSKENFLKEVKHLIQETISSNGHSPLTDMTLKHFSTEGKMLRPTFAHALAQSFDIDPALVINWATTCELLHNATLIHDDLQDGDEIRRGSPTTWKLYGSEQAINVGDYLLLISTRPVLLDGQEIPKQKLLELFTSMSARVVGGQVCEFELNKLENKDNLLNQYLNCIGGKTSTLFSGLALGVGLIANESEQTLKSIESIFFQLGNIFQIQDDILDLYGDKKRGAIGCDIKEGKISFLIATHLDKNPKDFEYLKNLLTKNRELTTEEDILELITIFESKGTKQTVLNALKERIETLEQDEYLQNNLVLKEMIQDCISKILLPVKHLMAYEC